MLTRLREACKAAVSEERERGSGRRMAAYERRIHATSTCRQHERGGWRWEDGLANLAPIDATASAPFKPNVCGSPHGAVPRFEVCAGIGIAGGKNQLELWSPTCRAEGRGDARACTACTSPMGEAHQPSTALVDRHDRPARAPGISCLRRFAVHAPADRAFRVNKVASTCHPSAVALTSLFNTHETAHCCSLCVRLPRSASASTG
jgi:hypothetical protein